MIKADEEVGTYLKMYTNRARNMDLSIGVREDARKTAQWLLELIILRDKCGEMKQVVDL